MSVFLGIDVGTQSVKVVAYDVDRRTLLQTTSAPLEMIARDDGSREQLASWWIDALLRCVLTLDAGLRRRVVGLSVSGQQHGLVAIDQSGQVLCSVKLWCDTSTAAECRQIMVAAGGYERCVELAGNPILPGYTASKLLWLKQSKPKLYASVATVLLPHDYVNFYLTGERFTEYGDASGTGWFDVSSRTWSKHMLRAIDADRDLSACMPALLPAHATLPLAPQIATELGLPRETIVAVGGGDNMMAAIGTRNVRPGRLTLSLGTSGTLFGFADRPIVDPRGELAAFCSSSGGWLPLVCTMNCTVATEQARKLANLELSATEAMLATTAPGAGGIVTLPFYNGERTPNLPDARAAVFGLGIDNTSPANLLRSAMEGATFGLRHGLQIFARHELKFDSVCLTGGGAASAVWRQMAADVFDLPVTVPRQPEGAALGAALQAAWAYQRMYGVGQSLPDLVDDHVLTDDAAGREPDASAVAAYRAAYERYTDHLFLLRSYHSQQGHEQ